MRKILPFSILLFSFVLHACKKWRHASNETKSPSQAEYLNIPYATISPAQKLDIFMPDSMKPQNPVLVWIHGGGWQSGDKSEFKNTNRFAELKKRGYAVVVINYRLSGEAKFPAQIHDVKAAIRWIKANASTYKFNAEKIGLWGASAGGHLSALAATSAEVTGLEDMSLGNSAYTSQVQAVVDWYGPVDFLTMDSAALAQGCSASNHSGADSPESKLLGHQITTKPDLVAKANPVTYITNDDPPFFIEHGLNDCTVPYGQSQHLYNKLLPVLGNEKVKLKLLEATGHGGMLFNDLATVKEAIDFLDGFLK